MKLIANVYIIFMCITYIPTVCAMEQNHCNLETQIHALVQHRIAFLFRTDTRQLNEDEERQINCLATSTYAKILAAFPNNHDNADPEPHTPLLVDLFNKTLATDVGNFAGAIYITGPGILTLNKPGSLAAYLSIQSKIEKKVYTLLKGEAQQGMLSAFLGTTLKRQVTDLAEAEKEHVTDYVTFPRELTHYPYDYTDGHMHDHTSGTHNYLQKDIGSKHDK